MGTSSVMLDNQFQAIYSIIVLYRMNPLTLNILKTLKAKDRMLQEINWALLIMFGN